jgi:hypothetical protein
MGAAMPIRAVPVSGSLPFLKPIFVVVARNDVPLTGSVGRLVSEL